MYCRVFLVDIEYENLKNSREINFRFKCNLSTDMQNIYLEVQNIVKKKDSQTCKKKVLFAMNIEMTIRCHHKEKKMKNISTLTFAYNE